MQTTTPLVRTVLALVTTVSAAVPASAQSIAEKPKFPPPPHETQAPAVEKNLKKFDMLDFDVFSNQKWDRLGETHAKDIVVTWPDGHETKGIETHIADLKDCSCTRPTSPSKSIPFGLDRAHGRRRPAS